MRGMGEISSCYTVSFERRCKHPVSRLWRAITDSEEVTRWMDRRARIDLRVGGDYFVDFAEEGALDGVLVRVEPERILAYAWGMTMVEWRLEPEADGCRYSFVHQGIAPRDVPDEEGLAAGWHVWLDDLEDHLDAVSTSRKEGRASWEALKPPYRAQLDALLGRS